MGYNINMRKVQKKAYIFVLFTGVLSILLFSSWSNIQGEVTCALSEAPSVSDTGINKLVGCIYNGSDFSILPWGVAPEGEFVNINKGSGTLLNFNVGDSAPAPGANVDGFGIRWRGNFTVSPDAGGNYRFSWEADDGIRIWVNNLQVVDEWNTRKKPKTTTDVFYLGGGTHLILVEYFEKTGKAKAIITWQRECTRGRAIYGESFFLACFYDNKDLSGTFKTKMLSFDASLDAPLDVNWGKCDFFGNCAQNSSYKDNFSVRFLGKFTFDEGRYRFSMDGDDGVRVYVDERLVLNHWGREGGDWEIESSNQVPIGRGRHEIIVHYQDYNDDAFVKVWWKRLGNIIGTAPPPGEDALPPGDTPSGGGGDGGGDTGGGGTTGGGTTGGGISGGIIVIKNPLKAENLKDMVDSLVNFVFLAAVAITPFMVLYAGFLFVTGGGNPQQITRARDVLIWTAIGIVVIVLSRGLIGLLGKALEVAE